MDDLNARDVAVASSICFHINLSARGCASKASRVRNDTRGFFKEDVSLISLLLLQLSHSLASKWFIVSW